MACFHTGGIESIISHNDKFLEDGGQVFSDTTIGAGTIVWSCRGIISSDMSSTLATAMYVAINIFLYSFQACGDGLG